MNFILVIDLILTPFGLGQGSHSVREVIILKEMLLERESKGLINFFQTNSIKCMQKNNF